MTAFLDATGLPFSGLEASRGREESIYKRHQFPPYQDRESPLKIAYLGDSQGCLLGAKKSLRCTSIMKCVLFIYKGFQHTNSLWSRKFFKISLGIFSQYVCFPTNPQTQNVTEMIYVHSRGKWCRKTSLKFSWTKWKYIHTGGKKGEGMGVGGVCQELLKEESERDPRFRFPLEVSSHHLLTNFSHFITEFRNPLWAYTSHLT